MTRGLFRHVLNQCTQFIIEFLTLFYLLVRKKIESWFVSPTNTEYFGIEETIILSINLQKKNTAEMNFSICPFIGVCEFVVLVLITCSFKDVLNSICSDFFNYLRSFCNIAIRMENS